MSRIQADTLKSLWDNVHTEWIYKLTWSTRSQRSRHSKNSQTRQAAWIQLKQEDKVESDGIILSSSQRYFVTHNIASSGLQTKEAAYLGKPSH